MKIYHGSPNGSIRVFQRRQANTGIHLPEHEQKNAIYLTSDFAFALLAGARPRGEGGGVRPSPGGNTIKSYKFNDPTKFNPNMPVYLYEWDIDELPADTYTLFEDGQVVVDLNELPAHEPIQYTAEKIFEYYEFSNWPPEPNEHKKEFKFR